MTVRKSAEWTGLPSLERVPSWLLPALCAALLVVASAVTIRWPPWGDEAHYLPAVRLFGAGISVDLLRTYPEMTAPLSFVAYAVWGHLVGFETWQLRLLSPLLAFGTCLLLADALRAQTRDAVAAIVGTLLVATNPYFLGLSVFVFTDMLALLYMTVAIVGVTRDRPWVTALGIAGAVLTRQYLAFLVPAVVLASLLGRASTRPWWRHAVAACVALVPLAGLVWLWDGGLNPLNTLRYNYVTGHAVGFSPHALSLYLAAPGIYLAPLLLWLARRGIRWSSVVVGLLGATFTLIFPIQPSTPQIAEGSVTVGFVHRALSALLPPAGVTAAWFIAAAGWIAAMVDRLRDAMVPWKASGATPAALLPWMGVVSFLVVMPFSYMPWEKYAVPLFLLVVLALPARARRVGANTKQDVASP